MNVLVALTHNIQHNCFGIPIRGRQCTILLFLNRFKLLKFRCPNLWCHTLLSSLIVVAKHWCSIIWIPILKVLFFERGALKISLQCYQTSLNDYAPCSLSSLSPIVVQGWEDYSSCWEHTTVNSLEVHQIVPTSKVKRMSECRVHIDFVCTQSCAYPIFQAINEWN